MKIKLFKILLIIILGIVIAGIVGWYLNYQLSKSIPIIEKESKKEEMKKTIETREPETKGIKSIPLEKPPFIKD